MNVRNAVIWIALLLLSICWSVTAAATEFGQAIDGLRFKDIRYLVRSLDDLGSKRAYALFFTNTTCPVAQKYLPRLVELDAKYRDQGVQFIAINSQANDSVRDSAAQQLESGGLFPFVKDEDGQAARALGVTHAAEVAVLDGQKRLVYRGRVDDQFTAAVDLPSPSQRDLERALDQVLAGEAVATATTAAAGAVLDLPVETKPTGLVTFHKDVEPILQKRCQACHHDGNAAPFALVKYEECAAHGEVVAEVVRDGRMPPWYADGRHKNFMNDPSLTAAERQTIAHWVQTGMDRGNAAEAPQPLTFSDSKWRIGEPDLVVSMPKPHSLPATGFIDYKYVILPHVFQHDTWLEAIEIRPENQAVVHHCNMAYLNAKELAGVQTFITGYVPGGQPMDMRTAQSGVGFLLPAKSALILQIHYVTTGQPEESTITVGLRFPRSMVRKRLYHTLLDPRDIAITPQHPLFAVSEKTTLDHDITVLGMFAHMHVRGRDMTMYAQRPGREIETLLTIPNYNFEWQLGYELMPGQLRLPKGTVLSATAHYDNSAFNPYNPDPARTVPYGDQTPDEMLNAFFFYTHDDESLSLKIEPQTGRVAQSEVSP